MAINSVNTSTDLANRLLQQPKPATQAQQGNGVTTDQDATKARQTEAQAAQQAQQAQQTQQPNPVVNAQGQTIGRKISVTA